MCAPMPEDSSTKSRELYGNRVAALGKGRPTAPGNSGHRSVTSPAPISTTSNAQISANDDTKSSARLISDSTSPTIPSSTPSERRSLSSPIEGSDEEQQDAAEHSSCHQEISIQLDAVSQPRVLPETDSGTSDPIIATMKTVERTVSPVNSSSAGPAVTTLPLGETPERVPSPRDQSCHPVSKILTFLPLTKIRLRHHRSSPIRSDYPLLSPSRLLLKPGLRSSKLPERKPRFAHAGLNWIGQHRMIL